MWYSYVEIRSKLFITKSKKLAQIKKVALEVLERRDSILFLFEFFSPLFFYTFFTCSLCTTYSPPMLALIRENVLAGRNHSQRVVVVGLRPVQNSYRAFYARWQVKVFIVVDSPVLTITEFESKKTP